MRKIYFDETISSLTSRKINYAETVELQSLSGIMDHGV